MSSDVALTDLAMAIDAEGVTGLPEHDDALATGARVIAEAVARRWVLVPGTLWEDEGAGADLLGFQGTGLTPEAVAALEARLRQEALAEGGVLAADVTVELDAARRLLAARGALETVEGPYELVLPLTPDTAAALAARRRE